MTDRRHPDATIRLIACDLDGTLLDDDGRAVSGVADALARLGRAGVPLVVVTGRPHGAAGRLCAAAALRPAVIASFHGGLVVDVRSGHTVRRVTVPRSRLVGVVETFVENGLEVSAYRGLEPAPEQVTRHADLPEEIVRLLAVGSADDVGRLFDRALHLVGGVQVAAGPGRARAVTGSPPTGHSVEASVGVSLRMERPLPTVIDVRHRLATKDRGLRAAARALGVPLSAVLAAGDGPSDARMLQAAGWGVAIGSSLPTAELASAADVVVPQTDLADYLLCLADDGRLP